MQENNERKKKENEIEIERVGGRFDHFELNASGPTKCLIRECHKPKVDWKVRSYDKLISGLHLKDMSPPPVTLDLTPKEVDAIAIDPSKIGFDFLPSHTQVVERRIQDVTGMAKAGYCIAVHPRFGNHFEQMSNLIFPRTIMKSFKSKQDFKSHRTSLVVTYSNT